MARDNSNNLNSDMVAVFPRTSGQEKLVQSISSCQITICTGPAGTGKAQALDELVLTPKGMVRIDSLKVGDLVRSATQGKDVPVLGVFPQGITETYRVYFADGTSTVTNPEHLWTVRDANKKAHDGIVTITTEEISKVIFAQKRKKRHAYRFSVLPYTPKIEGESNPWAYFEGLMLGNGYFGGSLLHISTNHRDYQEILKTLESLISPSNVYFPKESNTVQLNFSWKDLPEHLLQYKHCGQLSRDKRIKNNWYLWDYQSQLDLLAGLYDADGGNCNSKDGRVRLRFTSTSRDLIDLFKNLVRHTGGRACEEVLDPRSTKYSSGYCASVAFRHSAQFSRLKAKSFPRGKVQYGMSVAITSVTPDKPQETLCISIHAEDGLYVTTGYKTTHNTVLSIYEALQYQKQRLIREILYTKPIVEFSSLQGIGYLPGLLEEKLNPLLFPVRDNLKVFCGDGMAEYIIKQKKIEPILIQDLRGRSLNDAFLIVDEAQNLIPNVLEMIFTRIGDRAKIVVLGDALQKDSRDKFTNGLADAVDRLQGIPEVGIVALDYEDVLRCGGLVGTIQKRYHRQ